jgi:hypothetical protein
VEPKCYLKQEEPKKQIKQTDFTFNATCFDLKSVVEGIFRLLNQWSGIDNETIYNDILILFNLEVKHSGKGSVILVTDNDRKITRNPLLIADIKDLIKIPETDNRPENELEKQLEVQVTKGSKELFTKYCFCDARNAALELKEKGLSLFLSSESGNYKIYVLKIKWCSTIRF